MEALRLLQFGTSRFLQAHVDLFAHESKGAGGQDIGITVVRGSPDPARAHRLAALASPAGYPVKVRGLRDGQVVDEEIRVHSVRAGLSLPQDWPQLCDVFVSDIDLVVSNTADAGYKESAGDLQALREAGSCPAGFPARLCALLMLRWLQTGAGLSIFPCELISGNGDVLRGLVEDLARQANLPAAFLDWLHRDVRFVNSLVDRIVSEPIEPAGAVAEPYALWAIEGQGMQDAPFAHPAIQVVPELAPLERLKLHILNLGHTVLADRWLAGAPRDMLVRDAISDPGWNGMLRAIFEEEVLPAFAAKGMGEMASRYGEVTLERFANPFLEHRLADIAQNHEEKLERRIGAFLSWTQGCGVRTPHLDALLDRRGRNAH